MKISTARLKQIIKEELFYREFHHEGEALERIKEEKVEQRAWDGLVSKLKRLVLHAPLDGAAFDKLMTLITDLEKAYPIPERQPKRGEVQFFEEE